MKFRAFRAKSTNGRPPQWPDYNVRHAIILFMYLIEHNSLVARCSAVIYKLDTTSPSLVYTSAHNFLVSP